MVGFPEGKGNVVQALLLLFTVLQAAPIIQDSVGLGEP